MPLLTRMGFCAALSAAALSSAQTPANLAALKGLAAVTVLNKTPAGQAALQSNYAITAAVQNGTAKQPLLVPFAQQQQQALRDAFITGANAYQLADGLGSGLGAAYAALTGYTSADDGKTSKNFNNISARFGNLIAYAAGLSQADSSAGKCFIANGTQSDKQYKCTAPVSPAAQTILRTAGGVTDVFGIAYQLPSSDAFADPYGDSRPFQTNGRNFLAYTGADFFGMPSSNLLYLFGPAQNLRASPSFPSGHTTYGYTESLILALLLPERYQQMIARAAEYGDNRIVIGAHYAMDVLGGRSLAYYDMAHLLANDPAYTGQKLGKTIMPIADFQAALKAAGADLRTALALQCHASIARCAQTDNGRFASQAKNADLYEATQNYGLAAVYPATSEDVSKLAPEAGYLLTAAFPQLSLKQADDILTATEGPGGGFLDNGSSFGVYSRLDLYKAAGRAALQK